MKFLISLLMITNAYATCNTYEAQVIAKVKEVILLENACVYKVKVDDLNAHKGCPLTRSEINSAQVVDHYCQYDEGDTLKNILVRFEGEKKVYVD